MTRYMTSIYTQRSQSKYTIDTLRHSCLSHLYSWYLSYGLNLVTRQWSRIRKTWYISTILFQSSMVNETASFAGKWIEVQIIMLDEISQTQKGSITCFLFHMRSVIKERCGSRRELFIEGVGLRKMRGWWFERVRGNGIWSKCYMIVWK